MTLENALRNITGGKNRELANFLAEFVGTFILCLIGNASVAQNIVQGAAYIDINFAYGLGCAFGVYVSGGVSGGHINPAVTISETILGRLKPVSCVVYIVGQLLGAFLSSAVVYLVYYDAIQHVDPDRTIPGMCESENCTATAGIFSTYPTTIYPTQTHTLFFDQFFGTFLLVLIVSSFGDRNNSNPASGLAPYLVGSLVIALGFSFGLNCGYAINPARDLGPRIFSSFIYGSNVFKVSNYFFWIPIVGPICGAILGSISYIVLIGANSVETKLSSNRVSQVTLNTEGELKHNTTSQ